METPQLLADPPAHAPAVTPPRPCPHYLFGWPRKGAPGLWVRQDLSPLSA